MPSDNECPDLFPITDQYGNRKWVLMGARNRYIVGEFKKGGFVPCQAIQTLHYGKAAYAGQTFSNLPDGRVVRIDWDRWHLNTPRISGQMGFPNELALEEIDGLHYLSARPIPEIALLYDRSTIHQDLTLNANEKKRFELESAPYFIKISTTGLNHTSLKLTVFGRGLECNFSENAVKLGDQCAPLTICSDKLELTMIVDKCSIEIYLDGGKIYFSTVAPCTVCDYNLPYLELETDEQLTIEALELHSLKSIWRDAK